MWRCITKRQSRAGGDYYDFFPLPNDRLGVLIADASGHGAPAAVLMAVAHSIAHTRLEPPQRPGEFLTYMNAHLTRRYTRPTGNFMTAFYAVFDPANGTLSYASAGHNPPRLLRAADGFKLALNRAPRNSRSASSPMKRTSNRPCRCYRAIRWCSSPTA